MSPKSYCLEHTKPIFNELSILNVSNLYIQQTLISMFKIVKDHSPISVYDMFNFSPRDNFLVISPSFRLNVSQYNFVNRCSSLWNKFIGKVMEKNKPKSDGKIILGSSENSDFCAPVPFVKNKLKSLLLALQKGGDLNEWESSNFCNNYPRGILFPLFLSKLYGIPRKFKFII